MCLDMIEWAEKAKDLVRNCFFFTRFQDKRTPSVVGPPGFSGETDGLVLLGGYGRPDFEFVETHYLQCLDIPCLCNFYKGEET